MSPPEHGADGTVSSNFFTDPQQLAPPRTDCERRADGSIVLRSPEALQPHARCIGEWLERWAAETPETIALAERDDAGTGWRQLTYGELRATVGRLAQGLLELNLAPQRPIVVLSDNAIDHALLMLAAMHVGRAVCTVSSAYCRLTRDYRKIHGILAALDPALVYAADAAVYAPPLQAAAQRWVTVFSHGAENVPGAMALGELLRSDEQAVVREAFERIVPDDHAKYLLTSGSTGAPKVVINSHRMLCANQQMMAQTWRFLRHEKPVVLDWLPWSHTFGGNHNLNLVLSHGGTLYIDDGRPAPGLIEKSVRNLLDVKPTLYFNVPRGFDMLLPFLESDDTLAREFFARLKMVFYAGAALAPSSWQRLEAVARRVRDEPVWFTTSWGATETSPAVTSAHWKLERAGCIGAPLPGMELKLLPNGEKLEMRVRGVTVFGGYRGDARLTAAAFDDEGFYRIGDAGKLVDAARPELGVIFDGRVAEDFKLTSGTWVSVGTLRLKVISAFAPLVQDAVIAGHDRDQIGVLLFPSAAAKDLTAAELAQRAEAALAALRAEGGGSSQTPARWRWLTEPPNADAGEITDKGYVNQGAVLQRRSAEVEALFADDEA
jgi:feruloyl-CoA synthase